MKRKTDIHIYTYIYIYIYREREREREGGGILIFCFRTAIFAVYVVYVFALASDTHYMHKINNLLLR
jgi:hypothetical protein